MTFKTALIVFLAMTTPATAAEPLKRMQRGYWCSNAGGWSQTWECVGIALKSVEAGERAEVLERTAKVEKDPIKAARLATEAKIKRIEAESNAEIYWLKFPNAAE